MKNFKLILLSLSLAVVTGCGGGSNAGSSVFSPAPSASAPTATANALVISLSKSSLKDIASDTLTATITAIDASRNAIAGAPISVSVDGNAIVHVSGQSADQTGSVTATIAPGQDLSNRVVTITAVSGTITQTASFPIIGANVDATVTPGGNLIAGDTASVRVVVTDANQNPMPNQQVSISAPGIAPGNGVTGQNGDFTYSFGVPASVGSFPLTITAAGAPKTDALNIVAAGGSTPPASINVLSASVSANPTVVSINTAGDTTNQTTVSAVFVGANNARVPNVRVRFDLNGDVNSIGGTFTAGTSMIFSDPNGVASTNYIPGQIASPTNGVTVRACWDYNDFAVGTCPNQTTATLTVVAQALKVSIGTNNKVGVNPLTFYKDYVVVVNDAAGQAVKGVLVTPSLDLTAFYKGYYDGNSTGGVLTGVYYYHNTTGDGPYAWNGTTWVDHAGDPNTTFACPNEDQNRNGVLELNEDLNKSGKLDPSGVTITALDSSGVPVSGGYQTDASGLMYIRIEYPQSAATWIDFAITATAKVAATEGKAVYLGTLPAPSEQLKDGNNPPAFANSPYGKTPGCTNAQ